MNQYGVVPNKSQAIIWTNDGLIYWERYASVGFNILTLQALVMENTGRQFA